MTDHNNDSRFAKAVEEKNFESIERLFPHVSKGAKRKYITRDEFNPLHYASSAEIVRCLISADVDVNIKNPETDETPLLTVIKLNKSPDVVRELLKHGASIEARNKHTMNTPLNLAVHTPGCPLETIQALLEYGAAVNTANKDCDTPLYYACLCYGGDLRIVEALLKSGSPVNFRNLNGLTPLNACLRNTSCTAELVRILLNFNAKVEVNIIKDAIQNLKNDYLDIISELIQHASITSGEHWSSIVFDLLLHVRDEQKLPDCGKLLIKYAFLQCDDPHKSIINTFDRFDGIPFYFPFLFNLHIPVFHPDPIYTPKSKLTPVRDNLKSFADDCFSQIERMKTDMLENTNISVYQFVVSKTDKIGLDNKILKILKENAYPVYSDIILNKIKRAALVDKMVLQQVYTIAQRGEVAQKIILDVLSVCNVGKYLNEDEIKNLIEAYSDPSKDEYCFLDNLEEIEAHLFTKPEIRQSASKRKLASPIGHSSSKLQKKSSPRI